MKLTTAIIQAIDADKRTLAHSTYAYDGRADMDVVASGTIASFVILYPETGFEAVIPAENVTMSYGTYDVQHGDTVRIMELKIVNMCGDSVDLLAWPE